jgi:hypothetical protein
MSSRGRRRFKTLNVRMQKKRAGRRRPARREITRSVTPGANRRRPKGVVDAIGRNDETANRVALETPIFKLLIARTDEVARESAQGPNLLPGASLKAKNPMNTGMNEKTWRRRAC